MSNEEAIQFWKMIGARAESAIFAILSGAYQEGDVEKFHTRMVGELKSIINRDLSEVPFGKSSEQTKKPFDLHRNSINGVIISEWAIKVPRLKGSVLDIAAKTLSDAIINYGIETKEPAENLAIAIKAAFVKLSH
ncbi:hypothetical protein [Edwardsiella tarda]|uniref:Uncharacterized protein n=1 Tax=Edwardsiella tarda TaxID=636 RepID=A0A2A7U177_EDWTA|nr:hypothetical protein [Edwardsiella tarda]PEH72054.1 hypothetical protein CRM76_09055 [Edwardsiella tarda]